MLSSELYSIIMILLTSTSDLAEGLNALRHHLVRPWCLKKAWPMGWVEQHRHLQQCGGDTTFHGVNRRLKIAFPVSSAIPLTTHSLLFQHPFLKPVCTRTGTIFVIFKMPCSYCSKFFLNSNAGVGDQSSFTVIDRAEWASQCLSVISCSECSLIEKVVRAGAPEGQVGVRTIQALPPGPFLGFAVTYLVLDSAVLGSAIAGIQRYLFPFTATGRHSISMLPTQSLT